MSDDLIKPEWWHYPRPQARQLSDSESNQLAELRHEGCEAHCEECKGCIEYGAIPHTDSVGDTVCEDCCDICDARNGEECGGSYAGDPNN